jgi:hypothetical protein
MNVTAAPLCNDPLCARDQFFAARAKIRITKRPALP